MSGGWRLSDFDYHLPPELIAQAPVEPRDRSRLLVSRPDGVEDTSFHQIRRLLLPGDLVVINDTRVIPARLVGTKPTGGRVEVFLLKPCDRPGEWEALVSANKPVRAGLMVWVAEDFRIKVLEREGGHFRVRLQYPGDLDAAIERHGRMPLPPYISQGERERDRLRYQTVFAREPGAVAAPTAGLHFTEELLGELEREGVEVARLTLHVGLGTFQPVREEEVERHQMHWEWCRLPEATADRINRARRKGQRVVAVGTTVVRTIESAAVASGQVRPFEGETNLFILPGYRFRVVDRIITNFHLPRSTLLMLVAAFVGKARLERDYAHAIAQGYRFYSYGDTSFLEPDPAALG